MRRGSGDLSRRRTTWALAALLAASACGGSSSSTDGAATGDGSTSTAITSAEQLITRLLSADIIGDGSREWTATVLRSPLKREDAIAPASGTSAFVPTGDYWFAFVDRAPHAAFAHPTKYVFVDVATGKVTVEDQTWWPRLNGKGLALAGRPVAQVFAPLASPSPAAAKRPTGVGDASRDGTLRAAWVIYPDYTAQKAEGRLLVDGVGAGQRYLNVAADLDRDGKWKKNAEGPEWLVRNFAFTGGAGPKLSDPFELPLDAQKKFANQAWTRVSAPASPVEAKSSDEWDGSLTVTLDSKDLYFSFTSWTGPDCDSELSGVGCGAGLVGPREPPYTPPTVRGAPCAYFCKPEDQRLETSCKALVINLGDSPGASWMEAEMNKAWAFFSLRLGDGAATKIDRPTAEQALAAITAFVKDVKCLDEAHIYLIGHGYADGGIHAENGHGRLTPAQLKAAIQQAAHCPATMDHKKNECRQPGYCNLNVTIMSCYAGNFLKGDSSLGLPGVNVFANASSEVVSWGWIDGDDKGFIIGGTLRSAFTNDQADRAPNGNGDGVTTNEEAWRFASANYDRGTNDQYKSDPQSSVKADCNCVCASSTTCTANDAALVSAYAISTLLQSPLYAACFYVNLVRIVHSSGSVPIKNVAHDFTTIIRYAAAVTLMQLLQVNQLFNNSDFPCGQGPNGYTLCPTGASPVPAGDMVVLTSVLEKPVPLKDPKSYFQYGFVFDADGVELNNYQPGAQYPNDFFKGTDRWYVAGYDPAKGWTLQVTDASGGTTKPLASAARVIIKDNAMVLVVPAAEFKVAKPKFRLTAFRHGGDYGMKAPYDWDGSLLPAVADGLQAMP